MGCVFSNKPSTYSLLNHRLLIQAAKFMEKGWGVRNLENKVQTQNAESRQGEIRNYSSLCKSKAVLFIMN